MDVTQQFVSLARYGTIGVMIALILALLAVVYLMWKLATNHIEQATEAWNKNTEALSKLNTIIEFRLK